MIVKRFFDPRLAQTSYLIGCAQAGVAIVIDPLRDIAQYLGAANAEHLRITHVTETHIHADFLSGARDLARETKAQLILSDEGDADWKYAYAAADGARLVKDGDQLMIGNVRVRVMHTPGHTPEHISFLITDTLAADEPIGVVTGDFVFVGDVGRPDLLEKAAKVAGTMEISARTLYRSLQKFKELPDWLQIWPGHGAGSACGKGLSAVPHSTVGYEKRFNWAFAIDDEATFVKAVLEGQPEPPTYFATMKRMNKLGPAPYDATRTVPRGSKAELEKALADGAPVIDTRVREQFAAGHVRGTVSIPLNRSFTNWAGWLLPYDRDVFLIADEASAKVAARELAMIGIDRVAATFDPAIVTSSTGLQTIDQLTAADLQSRLGNGVAVIDVRAQAEWDAGHLPGATHIHLGHLMHRLADLPKAKTIVLQCQGGGRSSIAASLLQAAGVHNVANLEGGFEAWEAAGLPVEGSG